MHFRAFFRRPFQKPEHSRFPSLAFILWSSWHPLLKGTCPRLSLIFLLMMILRLQNELMAFMVLHYLVSAKGQRLCRWQIVPELQPSQKMTISSIGLVVWKVLQVQFLKECPSESSCGFPPTTLMNRQRSNLIRLAFIRT